MTVLGIFFLDLKEMASARFSAAGQGGGGDEELEMEDMVGFDIGVYRVVVVMVDLSRYVIGAKLRRYTPCALYRERTKNKE